MKILYEMPYGSKAWKSKYANDSDYIFIVDKLDNGKEIDFHKDKINDIDIIYMTKEYITNLLQGAISKSHKCLCSLYMELNNLDFPIKNIDWLKTEKTYKENYKDVIINDLDKNDKYLYTYYILFKMWETKDNIFKEEYTQVVNDFKFKQNIDVMKEYIKKEIGVIHNA